MKNISNDIDLLILFQVGLKAGILDTDKLVKLVEKVIEEEDKPDYLFIEISLCGTNKNKLIEVLSNYTKRASRKPSGSYIFGTIRSSYLDRKIDLKSAINLLYILRDELDLTDDQVAFIYNIVDQYDLAFDGSFGSIEEVERDLLSFLGQFQKYNIRTHVPWKEPEND